MNVDLIFLHYSSINKEVCNLLPLITLQLDEFAELLVLHNITVAAELLFETLEDLVGTKILFQTLNCCQAFLTVPLLDSDMNIIFCPSSPKFLGLSRWDLNV
ncbi:hypothetical protein V6N12_072602 [Hibiscus sabdariffa]|uniref:Uncharacterized protein n=1 Tax=Hibiscus sabdariffa TaxID=183260 RepID=A0ABR2BJP8_9ROSI